MFFYIGCFVESFCVWLVFMLKGFLDYIFDSTMHFYNVKQHSV
jgi:hypothetical protein